MNKLLFLLLLFCTTTLFAQPNQKGHPREERAEQINPEQHAKRFARIKAARQAFIIEELEITEKQAAAFFPVYWDFDQRMVEDKKDIARRNRPDQPSKKLTEQEARTKLLERRTQKKRIMALSLEAENKYLEILPATKVLRLPDVEREFRKKLWERTRKQ
ncbi:MAG: hypothetical protein OTI34_06550 [Lewinella sp.]|nr:hypothetical protein [Lewinella sp.]